ncbi:MAG: carbonic anhydrase, partial [Microcystaceae cyanobacterium]
TRLLVKENYGHLSGEDLLEVTIAENILNQLVNLQTYPVVRSRVHQRKLSLHGLLYRIETGEVFAYDGVAHEFSAPQSRINTPEPEYTLHPSSPLIHQQPFTVPQPTDTVPQDTEPEPAVATNGSKSNHSYLSTEQAERIYRGSYS